MLFYQRQRGLPGIDAIDVDPQNAKIELTTTQGHSLIPSSWCTGPSTTMYYPVAVKGALFSAGDSHASQGDSELCGTAIECSLTGTFQLIVRKRETLKGTALEGLDFPLLETQEDWCLHGFSFANYLEELDKEAQSEICKKSSIDLALRDALRKMRRFLMTTQGLSDDEAIS